MQAGQDVNSVLGRAVEEVVVRTIPGVNHAQVRETLRQYLGDDIERIEPFVDLDSMWTDPADPWVQRVFRIAGAHLDEPPAVEALPFFTDASVY